MVTPRSNILYILLEREEALRMPYIWEEIRNQDRSFRPESLVIVKMFFLHKQTEEHWQEIWNCCIAPLRPYEVTKIYVLLSIKWLQLSTYTSYFFVTQTLLAWEMQIAVQIYHMLNCRSCFSIFHNIPSHKSKYFQTSPQLKW